jgi:hypothetical protein
MKKTNVLWSLNNLIFPVIFNALFFLLGGTEHRASVWISFGFINFAYLMLLLTPKLVRSGKSSAVFGFSLFTISATYFFAELVIGIAFILASPESHKAVLLIQLCIAGLYGVMLISHMIANEHTADAEEKRQCEIDYVKNASMKLKMMLEQVKDKDAKRAVERLYDALYSSPVKSHPNLAQIESHILQLINDLENVISTVDAERIKAAASSLLTAVNERNMRLKTMH